MNREENTNLQNWLLDHNPGDEMVYKKAWWDVYIFIREIIVPMFNTKSKDIAAVYGSEYFKKKAEDINEYCSIIGTHWSKSILHPVIKIVYKDVTIVFRYNFYDYEIAVVGDVPIIMPDGLMYSNKCEFFYEGFPYEYLIEDRFQNGMTKFIIGCVNNYEFYAFMVIMKALIDQYRDTKRMTVTAWYKCRRCGVIFEDTTHTYTLEKDKITGRLTCDMATEVIHDCDNNGHYHGYADLYFGPRRREVKQ